MKIIGIIPARYKSTRFEGKPLADICGKPMIWWTYQQSKKVKEFDEVYVATDNEKIKEICELYDMKVIMTSDQNETPTDRIYEVSEKITSDIYVSINGDEPLIEPDVIKKIIPNQKQTGIYVANIMTQILDPVEVIDFTNLKIVTNDSGKGIYISRSPIPYPKGTMDCVYKKHVGVYAFNKEALNFYKRTKRGNLEKIEDIDLLRFIENEVQVDFIDVKCKTLSVDTPKDLKRVIDIIKERQ